MIAYKLFRLKNGNLYPLYVNATKPTPMGVWLNAEIGELVDSNHVKAHGCGGSLSLRPGWHLSDTPYAGHIGKRNDNGVLEQRQDSVWCECEYSDSICYQELVNEYGRNNKGVVIKKNACMKAIPIDGYYRYKTNPKQIEEWIIAGAIKIKRMLSNEEVAELCKAKGIEPQKIAS